MESALLSWNSFSPNEHYKTAIISECTVSPGLFFQCLRSKLGTEPAILLTRFCKKTRVAVLSEGGGCLNASQWHDTS